MNILVAELQLTKGHTSLFENTCNVLRDCGYNVTAIVPSRFMGYLDGIEIVWSKHTYYADECSVDTPKNRIYHNVKNALFVKGLLKSDKFDLLLIVTYDEIGLSLTFPLFASRTKIFVIHNNNLDNIASSKYRRFAFSLFKDKVTHVVLAGFIKNNIVKHFNLKSNRVIVFPHPIRPLVAKGNPSIDCVGLSNGNDENIIWQLIEAEKENDIFKKKGIKIVLKSNKYQFDDGFLTIINGFIDGKLYDSYIANAKSIFMPFPLDFNNRVSGTLMDALANNKPVIATGIPVVKKCSETYDRIIKVFDLHTFILDIVSLSTSSDLMQIQFDEFKKYHNNTTLAKKIKANINKIFDRLGVEDYYDF